MSNYVNSDIYPLYTEVGHVYNDIYSQRWLYIHWLEHPADPNRHLLPIRGKMPNQSRIPTTSQKYDKKLDWAKESQVL